MSLHERPARHLKEMGRSAVVLGLGALLWTGLLGALSLLVLAGCGAHSTVVSDYETSVRSRGRPEHGAHDFVFLIDGLTQATLMDELGAGRLPNIRAFFLGATKRPVKLARAMAPVPSLTYPSLASWLTSSPVQSHGVFGNQIHSDGLHVNFENVLDRQEFSRRIGGANVFSRLASRDQQTLNLSYITQMGASVQASVDPGVGVAALQGNHSGLDEAALAALSDTLTRRSPADWPRLSWVHLIGFDHAGHEQGPGSKAAREALHRIDRALAPVLQELARAERAGHLVRVLMSGDHGMVDVDRTVELPPGWIPQGRAATASHDLDGTQIRKTARQKGVSLVVWKDETDLVLKGRRREIRARLDQSAKPPGQLSAAAWIGLCQFFSAHDAPTAIAFASRGATFEIGESGSHGGLTDEEMYPPLLHRGWPNVAEVTPVHRLLAWVGTNGAVADAPAATPLPFDPPRPALEVTTRTLSENYSGSSNALALGAKIGLRPQLSRQWALLADYGFLSTRWQGKHGISHSARAGAVYWLGEKSSVGVSVEGVQIWGPRLSAVLDVESRGRVLSLGDGDLVFGGGLGLMDEGGFRAGLELTWEHYLTFRDLGGFRFKLEQAEPGEAGRSRGEVPRGLVGLEVFYRFGG